MWERVYHLDDGRKMFVNDNCQTMRDAEKAHIMSMRTVDDLGFIAICEGDVHTYLNLNHVIYVAFEESEDQ